MTSLIDSFPPDITENIPFYFTKGGETAAKTFKADERFDVHLNGLGFLLRARPDSPYERAGEQVRKQQIDSSNEAGEQTLSSWWIRSQVSWHNGAGVRWYEPGAEAETAYRFADSQGVDVWTEGELSLLRDTTTTDGFAADTTLLTLRREGVDGYVRASNTALAWVGPTTLTASVPTGGATQPAATGQVVWVGHTGGVSKWDVTGAGALTTPLTCTGRARVWWIKQRLFVAIGNTVWWVAPSATGVLESVGQKVVEHPDASWVWTDVAETPDAILLSGASGSESVVMAVTLEDADPLPLLSSPRQVLVVPRGEQVTCMGTYLGSYVVFGTTAGVRVGTVGQSGTVSLGPLTVKTDSPVADVSFNDRFAYVAVTAALPDGSSGVARVDLSAQIGDTGLYAWAWDVSAKAAGAASAVAFVGNTDRVVVAAGGTVATQHATQFVGRGWLQTGRVRYRTTELKSFQSVKLAGVLNNGKLDVTAVTDDDVEHRVMSYGPTTGIEGEAAVRVPGRARLANLGFRLSLSPSPGGDSPVVAGFSVKAFPVVAKPRLVRFPLSCFDFEKTRDGDTVGMDGGALLRVYELEALENAGAPVQVRDVRSGDAFTGLIEAVEFAGTESPDADEPNFGGVVSVTVRVM